MLKYKFYKLVTLDGTVSHFILFLPFSIQNTMFRRLDCLRLQAKHTQLGPIDRANPASEKLCFKQKQDDG
jgi:hypothetical protein